MTTFRAAYINDANLTSRDQAHLSDAELTEAAVIEARSAGLIGDDRDANQITEAELRDGLVIGDFSSRWA